MEHFIWLALKKSFEEVFVTEVLSAFFSPSTFFFLINQKAFP